MPTYACVALLVRPGIFGSEIRSRVERVFGCRSMRSGLLCLPTRHRCGGVMDAGGRRTERTASPARWPVSSLPNVWILAATITPREARNALARTLSCRDASIAVRGAVHHRRSAGRLGHPRGARLCQPILARDAHGLRAVAHPLDLATGIGDAARLGTCAAAGRAAQILATSRPRGAVSTTTGWSANSGCVLVFTVAVDMQQDLFDCSRLTHLSPHGVR